MVFILVHLFVQQFAKQLLMHSQIAQLAEQRTVNPLVVGSSPTLGAMMIDIESRLNQEHINCQRYDLLGKQIELVYTDDQYTNLKPGDTGIINFIDDFGTLHVNWDNGSSLGLISGVDKWTYV